MCTFRRYVGRRQSADPAARSRPDRKRRSRASRFGGPPPSGRPTLARLLARAMAGGCAAALHGRCANRRLDISWVAWLRSRGSVRIPRRPDLYYPARHPGPATASPKDAAGGKTSRSLRHHDQFSCVAFLSGPDARRWRARGRASKLCAMRAGRLAELHGASFPHTAAWGGRRIRGGC